MIDPNKEVAVSYTIAPKVTLEQIAEAGYTDKTWLLENNPHIRGLADSQLAGKTIKVRQTRLSDGTDQKKQNTGKTLLTEQQLKDRLDALSKPPTKPKDEIKKDSTDADVPPKIYTSEYSCLVQSVDDDWQARVSTATPYYYLVGENIYAPQRVGNTADFFTTGEDYYKKLGVRIDKAKKSIFITGWQINYDIQLDGFYDSKEPYFTAEYHAKIAQHEKEIEILEKLKQQEIADFEKTKKKYLAEKQLDKLKIAQEHHEKELRIIATERYAKTQNIVKYATEYTEQRNKKARTLWQALRSAVQRGVKVYVLPWLSPPFPADLYTRCFETMLAVFQLNCGLPEQRAFCIPANGQSDVGRAGLFFAHHQKSIIIDNEIGYLGGIDLAYGRRDNNLYRLKSEGRIGSDNYNSCIPAINDKLESQTVSLMGLVLSTFFEEVNTYAPYANYGLALSDTSTVLGNWWQEPMTNSKYLWIKEAIAAIKKKPQEIYDKFMTEVVNEAFMLGINALMLLYRISRDDFEPITAQGFGDAIGNGLENALNFFIPMAGDPNEAEWMRKYHEANNPQLAPQKTGTTIDPNSPLSDHEQRRKAEADTAQKKLTEMVHKIGNNTATPEDYIEILPTLYNWICSTNYSIYANYFLNATGSIISDEYTQQVKDASQSLMWYLYSVCQKRALKQKKPYYFIAEKPQPLFPNGGKTINTNCQPRMPWHDVQIEISGASVYDLSRNFIDRWNSAQHWIANVKTPTQLPIIKKVVEWATCLYKEKANNTVKDMLSWTNDQLNSFKAIQYLQEELAYIPPEPHYIMGDLLPKPPKEIPIDLSNNRQAIVQIIRSASAKMVKEENAARKSAGMQDPTLEKRLTPENHPIKEERQNNCLRAWIEAIKNSRHFLYIETQFFQSEFGEEFGYNTKTVNVLSGPMSKLVQMDPKYINFLKQVNIEEVLKTGDLNKMNWENFARICAENRSEKNIGSTLLAELLKAVKATAVGVASYVELNDVSQRVDNPIAKTIVERIAKAIRKGERYHVYLVVPVHPEGMLNSDTTIHQNHLTMQSISHGTRSLIKRIKREIYICKEMTKRNLTDDTSIIQELDEIERTEAKPPYINEEAWTLYLTLLNLRTWEYEINQTAITEQVYVHSKLLIADDNIAIIGSCNVNERSMAGDRDSELAAIVRGHGKGVGFRCSEDENYKRIKIDGVNETYVNRLVHEFRVKLWSKHFGLEIKHPNPRIQPLTKLVPLLEQPANIKTHSLIQETAAENAKIYWQAFKSIPQNTSPVQAEEKEQSIPDDTPTNHNYPVPSKSYYPLGCSIWAQWAYKNPNDFTEGGELKGKMPFQQEFWLEPSYASKQQLPVVYGFIVALPTEWTLGENNTSKMHGAVVAFNEYLNNPVQTAQTTPTLTTYKG